MTYGLKTYARTNIETADQRKIIVLLYEGAIERLNKACKLMEDGERDEQGVLINKTLKIVNFLANALDMEEGGELAENLINLYDYIRDILLLANIENEPTKVREAIELFATLLDGWRGIMDAPARDPDAPAKIVDPLSPDPPVRFSMVG